MLGFCRVSDSRATGCCAAVFSRCAAALCIFIHGCFFGICRRGLLSIMRLTWYVSLVSRPIITCDKLPKCPSAVGGRRQIYPANAATACCPLKLINNDLRQRSTDNDNDDDSDDWRLPVRPVCHCQIVDTPTTQRLNRNTCLMRNLCLPAGRQRGDGKRTVWPDKVVLSRLFSVDLVAYIDLQLLWLVAVASPRAVAVVVVVVVASACACKIIINVLLMSCDY